MSTSSFLSIECPAIAEQVTARITGTILDDTGTAIPASALTTLTLTLYVVRGGAIVNSRNGGSVLNTNGGTVDANGLLTMVLDPADNVRLNGGSQDEPHVAMFTWTYNGGAATGRALVSYAIADLSQVT